MHNGDYSGRRFSPLTTIDTIDRVVADAGLGLPAEPRQRAGGRRRPDVGHDQGHAGRRQRRACTSRSPITSGPWTRAAAREIWHATWPSKGGWHIGNRGVAVLGQHGLRRNAGLQSGGAQHPRRPREVAHRDLRSRAVLLRLRRSAHRQEPRHRRRERRRSRHPRLPAGARSGDRRAAVALVRLSGAGHARGEDRGRASKR